MSKLMKFESEYIRDLRKNLGLGRTELANLLGLGTMGERTIRGWEDGEHKPSPKKWQDIHAIEKMLKETLDNAPFRHEANQNSASLIFLLALEVSGYHFSS